MDRTQYTKRAVGHAGENAALDYLLAQGYEPVERNLHSRFGEIDLIVRNTEYLVFVEVKTRSASCLSRPAAFVTPRKQQKLIKTAQLFLEQYPCGLQPRFDVVEVINTPGGVRLEHLENAFWPEDGTAF